MPQKPLYLIVAIAVVGLLIALVFLPGIAGLIEGDFGYLRDQADQGWNNSDSETKQQAIADIYVWSYWKINLRDEAPKSYRLRKLKVISNELNDIARSLPLED